jgi:hypothetical protein
LSWRLLSGLIRVPNPAPGSLMRSIRASGGWEAVGLAGNRVASLGPTGTAISGSGRGFPVAVPISGNRTRLDPLDYSGLRGEGSTPVPLPPPFLRHSSPLYPIIRIYRRATENLGDVARFFAQSRSFSPWVRRTILPYCSVLFCIPLFEATVKTTSSAIKAVAASSAMLPLSPRKP